MSFYNLLPLNPRDHQVYIPKTRRCIGMLLLLALCWVSSPAWAASSQQPAWKKNMKVGVEVGFGAPYGWAINKINKENFKKKGLPKIEVGPNWRLGVVWGYGFPISDNALAIGPDIGLFIGTKRRCEIAFLCGANMTVEEQYLHVPLALKLATIDKDTGVQEGGLTLGYEFSILLSSKCNSPASGLSVASNAMLERAKDMAKSSRLSGSIFLGGKVDLSAGCYLMGQFKFPITDFLGFQEADQGSDDAKKALQGVRTLGSSLVELSLGLNLMKWL